MNLCAPLPSMGVFTTVKICDRAVTHETPQGFSRITALVCVCVFTRNDFGFVEAVEKH